ncbi:MAG: cytochrome b N-terminal domain-containing protein [Chloroflexia bacterium]|nr:cytochrome b N-terminal domain-containing protein [Chloroflexia bacterium]
MTDQRGPAVPPVTIMPASEVRPGGRAAPRTAPRQVPRTGEGRRVAAPRAAKRDASRAGWVEERLDVTGLNAKYGRKAFPVHTTFFLGEMAAFAFIILIVTGIYLGLIYIPSSAPVEVDGQELPEAYASVRLIESIPVANLFRNVHHWAAHVMVLATLLHLIRIFFFGTYRRPRELNWIIGVVMLILTLVAGFLGYALPFDSYAVTATGIGYSIARSIPWVGNVAAELFFGGAFPTLGSLPRLYTLHIFVVPALIALTTAAHILLIVKNKHSQPGYARKLAEPGRVLGVPAWPYQALLAGQLFLLMFGALFILSALFEIHPLAAYGPPGPGTPAVKPDWYLLWVYGFLDIVPASLTLTTPIGTIGPQFIGGIVFPGIIFTLIFLAPWLDRTNRGRDVPRFEYLQPPAQAPVRLTIGVGFLTYIGMLFVAGYHVELGLSIAQTWYLSLIVPAVVMAATYGIARQRDPAWSRRFDPSAEEEDEEVLYVEAPRGDQ